MAALHRVDDSLSSPAPSVQAKGGSNCLLVNIIGKMKTNLVDKVVIKLVLTWGDLSSVGICCINNLGA